MFSSFGRSKMKWERARLVMNPWVAEGWKSACEKHRILSNSPLQEEEEH
jgi:hypothetical protein